MVVLLGRNIGSEGVGMIFGILSLVLIFQPLTDFGYIQIMIREIARDRDKSKIMISRTLGFSLVCSFFFSIIIVLISIFIEKFPFKNVLILTLSYSMVYSLIRVWRGAFQAVERMEFIAVIEITERIIQLAGVVVLILLGNINIVNTLYVFLLSTVTTCIISFSMGYHFFGFIPFKPVILNKERLIESSHFSLNYLGGSVFLRLDKIMLSKLSTLSSVGIYVFAQKVLMVFVNLMGALIMASYPRFFKLGGKEKSMQLLKFSKKIGKYISILGILGGILVFIAAPWIVKLLGASFEESILAMRILAVFPLLRGLSLVFGNILTGTDYQKERMQIVWFGAFLNFILNLILIIKFGWRGAAYATLISYGLVTLFELAMIKIKDIFVDNE